LFSVLKLSKAELAEIEKSRIFQVLDVCDRSSAEPTAVERVVSSRFKTEYVVKKTSNSAPVGTGERNLRVVVASRRNGTLIDWEQKLQPGNNNNTTLPTHRQSSNASSPPPALIGNALSNSLGPKLSAPGQLETIPEVDETATFLNPSVPKAKTIKRIRSQEEFHEVTSKKKEKQQEKGRCIAER